MAENCRKFTLCWDCENATGGCCWSDHWLHQPVPGWTAEPRQLRLDNHTKVLNWQVLECPEFKRDAFGGGIKWADPAKARGCTLAELLKNCQKRG